MTKVAEFLYMQIAESIRRRILSGELQPGDKLESVRAMAARWNCTPGTVNRAYAALSQDGLVEGRRGRGTLVATVPIQPSSPTWNWAALVNNAERFLLEALQDGHNLAHIENALSTAISRWEALQQETRQADDAAPSNSPHGPLLFAGSHDIAIETIDRYLREMDPGEGLEFDYRGSLGGLLALARGEADIAGAHLWDEHTNTYNIPYLRRIFPGRALVLLTLAHRKLGLILPPGNPQKLKGLADYQRPELKFVHRQAGSGTHIWLETQLRQMGIHPQTVDDQSTQTTHFGVADRIASGAADAGIGIFAAAASQGLDFIPLALERYELILPKTVWESDRAQKLVEVVRSSEFQEDLSAMGGYELTASGETRTVG
jgi:molybdate-binding protein/DNA-binding transcriptional regulator YhcF (GntR family)